MCQVPADAIADVIVQLKAMYAVSEGKLYSKSQAMNMMELAAHCTLHEHYDFLFQDTRMTS